MRIQHNIMAMNAYRNYNNNTSAVAKNLEKLSSGYRINRAGDDAAGLAISEKMRAQITALGAAQKNVKDGISLVKTAEGATQEIHDMLNRMVSLAEQSSNGTYQDDVDRDAIQNEFTALKTEINRIADASNFNGIKLLDGSLAGSGAAAGSAVDVAVEVASGTGVGKGTPVPQESEATITTASTTVKAGDKVTLTAEMSDGTKHTYELEVSGTNLKYKGSNLTQTLAAGTAVTAAEAAGALVELLGGDDGLGEAFTVSGGTGGKVTVKSAAGAFGDPSLKNVSMSVNGGTATNYAGNISTNKEGKGKFSTVDVANLTVYDASSTTKDASKSVVTVNGQKFAFAKDEASAKELGADVNVVFTGDNTAPDAADAKSLVQLMNQKLGTNIKSPATGTSIEMISKGGVSGGGSVGAGGGLVLQIGDTSDDYNQLTVSIADMHAEALGIASLDLNSQTGAQAALQTIKDAINKVSSTRGELGATQNRLEHTSNNLSTMKENIQDAEATIRDTDIAEEMMAYTKNNILVQSAQAMLAQANQIPQGVLQLLG